MLRRAYVHGVNNILIKTGAVRYASEELAAELADAISDAMPIQPVESLPPEATSAVASTLVDLSNKLESAAASAHDAATAAAMEDAIATEIKGAQVHLHQKLSEIMGTAVNPNDASQANTLANAGEVTPEAALEAIKRPQQYASSPTSAQSGTGAGSVGTEYLINSQAAGTPVPGTNTAVDATNKSAALNSMIRKIAAGAAVDPANIGQINTLTSAAATTPEAMLELIKRPNNYAAAATGGSVMQAQERASAIGTEMAHPNLSTASAPVAGGSNSAIDQIPGKDKTVVASDQQWLAQFKEVGAKYAQAFPFYMNEAEKVAGIQYLMGLTPSDRESVTAYMRKTAELPEGLRQYIENKKKDEKGTTKEEKDSKKKEKKTDGNKSDEADETSKTASYTAGDIISKLRQLQR